MPLPVPSRIHSIVDRSLPILSSSRRRRLAALLATIMMAGVAAAHPPGASAPPIDDRQAAVIEFLEQRLERTPDDSVALAKLGSAWLDVARRSAAHGHYDEAAATFRRLLEVEPTSTSGHVGLAYAYLGKHRFHEALDLAREAAFAAPDEPEIIALLGDVHYALGNYPEADALFRQLLDTGITLQSLSRSALMLQTRGDLDGAESMFRDAVQAGEMLGAPTADMAWCYTMLGELLDERGRTGPAEEAYRQALELDAAAHAAAAQLAAIEQARGDDDAALDRLRRVVEQQPEPKNWIALARLHEQRGETQNAKRLYELALEDMEHDVAHGDLGHARELVELWIARGTNADEAAALALRDLREIRQDVGAYETAAWALHHAERHDEAAGLALAALRRAGPSPRMLERAAIIFDGAGREAEAAIVRERLRQRGEGR